jgi:hypothetical protein
MMNQIYVEKLTPPVVIQAYPIVFVHGLGQIATNFLETPDGHPGWANFFLWLRGLPQRSAITRSVSMVSIYRDPFVSSTNDTEVAFTATSSHDL